MYPDLPDNVIKQQPSSVIADLSHGLKGKRRHTKVKFNTEIANSGDLC